MHTTIERLKMISIGTLAVLSLLVSPVAACLCAHHQESAEAEMSCHRHSPDTLNDAGAQKPGAAASSNENCICASIAPKALAKSEGVKLKKLAAATAAMPETAAPGRRSTEDAGSVAAGPPAIRDPLYNLKPSRGPPVS